MFSHIEYFCFMTPQSLEYCIGFEDFKKLDSKKDSTTPNKKTLEKV